MADQLERQSQNAPEPNDASEDVATTQAGDDELLAAPERGSVEELLDA